MKSNKIIIATTAIFAISIFVIVTILTQPKNQPTPHKENEVSYIMNADGSLGVASNEEKTASNNAILSRTNPETNEMEYSEDGGQTWTKMHLQK